MIRWDRAAHTEVGASRGEVASPGFTATGYVPLIVTSSSHCYPEEIPRAMTRVTDPPSNSASSTTRLGSARYGPTDSVTG